MQLPLTTIRSEERWEQGSDFHLMQYAAAERPFNPWKGDSRPYASGRDAFRALLLHGMEMRGWKRLLVPSYYCQFVVASLKEAGMDMALYPDAPGPAQRTQRAASLREFATRKGDVLLKVNFFGLGSRPDYGDVARGQVEIIEDHTHDPWSGWAMSSRADWCVASLRKTLPVPDGAMLWSPAGHALPPPAAPTRERQEASSKKIAAMLLKNLYLHGHPVSKDDFRRLYIEAEESLRSGDASAMTVWSVNLLRSFPLQQMRSTRRQNHACLSRALQDIPGLDVLQVTGAQGTCPFSCVMVLDTAARRDHLLENLISRRVYPAVLWPLESPVCAGVPLEHRELSRRMLSLHCDARYSEQDMIRVAGMVREISLAYGQPQRGGMGVAGSRRS
ncbi:MAG TPA: DegT/DnrJ/EryC1/StrS family aminotransferase [Noviherbaspirillum sp.]|uniref:DegT/DnrJ/EryC1/StrS family aminotransferase n=1 Tax=Noviherbaspirillum sp. TaxID=1926288 RepID=UPI002B478417|nr:DegT/DnrJ/EryC1/StrS family aminotransferase [Noviherbaspirillum sp.]HJV84471.1 DegT/DnrJ/EryC1/StrS family aminotransferase [Noviherbaspirillum sp.]